MICNHVHVHTWQQYESYTISIRYKIHTKSIVRPRERSIISLFFLRISLLTSDGGGEVLFFGT